jgi:glycosyltransferase involved in cell wall biosynthesis
MRPSGSAVTVGLAMIVKNEALTLPRLAQSLDGQLDHWTIVDTGSTDDTVAVAREHFAGVPGQVIEDEWRGYGPSRNVALEAARPHTDFALTLDADDTFHGSIDRAIPPEYDGVEAEYVVEPLRFWVPRLIRTAQEWTWRGRAHEYLSRVDAQANMFKSSSFHVEHHADGGNRATKFQRELGLLQADQRDNPEDPRTAFYLARTYEDGAEYARAATWYRTRIRLGGWEEETWYATWRLGLCLLRSGKVDEGCGVLWRSWGQREWRAEPLWSLAEHYRQTSQWRLSFEACELARRYCGVGGDDPGGGFRGDRLFVHLDAYTWRIAYEQSITAYYVGARELGLTLTEELLERSDLPPEIAANVAENRRFYLEP